MKLLKFSELVIHKLLKIVSNSA